MPANFSAAAVLNINGTVRITVSLGQFAGTNYRVLAPLAVPFLYTPFQKLQDGTVSEGYLCIIHYVSGASQCNNKFYHIASPLRRQEFT